MPVVFSPFQTVLHLECPVKRILAARENWVPRRIEQRDISSLLGVAIAAGLEQHNKGLPDPKARAMQHAEELQKRTLLYRTLPEWHQSQWDRVPARAEAAVFAYTSLPDMLPGKVTAVEAPYGPSGGNARPDLLLDDGRHARVPFDYKTTLSLGRTKADAERKLRGAALRDPPGSDGDVGAGRPPDLAGHGSAGCGGPRAVPGGAARR